MEGCYISGDKVAEVLSQVPGDAKCPVRLVWEAKLTTNTSQQCPMVPGPRHPGWPLGDEPKTAFGGQSGSSWSSPAAPESPGPLTPSYTPQRLGFLLGSHNHGLLNALLAAQC